MNYFSILPPVIDRELRLRSRQAGTYWGRCAVAGLAVLVCLEEMEAVSASVKPFQAGAKTFSGVSWLAFLVACAVTLVTADCLSRERREGTLGLLLLTDLKGLDVVLGKLCVAGLTAASVLVGFLPAVGLVMLEGGVSYGEVGRTALALLNAAFVALSAGIWVSGRAQSRSGAARGSLLLITGLCVLPGVLAVLGLSFYRQATGPAAIVSLVSPITAFTLARDATYAAVGACWLYWSSLGVCHALGWGLLIWTGLQLRFNWRAIEWKPPPKPIVWEPASEQEAAALAAEREERKKKDPLCWAISRMRIQNAMIWMGALALLLGGTGFTWDLLMFSPAAGPRGLGVWSGLHLLFSLGAAGLLAWAAGRFFFEAQRNGELELLLSTPLGAAEIVGANWRALCQPLRGAWLLVGFLCVLGLVLSPQGAGLAVGIAEKALPVAWRVLDIIALCWIGMWFGLQARKPISIMAWPAGLVVGFPWVIAYVLVIWMSFSNTTRVTAFWFLAWPFLNIIKDMAIIVWAVDKLREELRTKVSLAAGNVTE